MKAAFGKVPVPLRAARPHMQGHEHTDAAANSLSRGPPGSRKHSHTQTCTLNNTLALQPVHHVQRPVVMPPGVCAGGERRQHHWRRAEADEGAAGQPAPAARPQVATEACWADGECFRQSMWSLQCLWIVLGPCLEPRKRAVGHHNTADHFKRCIAGHM